MASIKVRDLDYKIEEEILDDTLNEREMEVVQGGYEVCNVLARRTNGDVRLACPRYPADSNVLLVGGGLDGYFCTIVARRTGGDVRLSC